MFSYKFKFISKIKKGISNLFLYVQFSPLIGFLEEKWNIQNERGNSSFFYSLTLDPNGPVFCPEGYSFSGKSGISQFF